MKRLAFALLLLASILSPHKANAQAAVTVYCDSSGTGTKWVPCSTANPLPVSGGGGGLSVTDSAAWTTGVSKFTPSGGEYNLTPATVSSGQQGTFAMSSFRNLYVDVPTSNNNLYTALTSPIVAGTNVIGYTSNDPCAQQTKLGKPFSITSSTQLITGTSAKSTYICGIDVVTASAQNIALVEGTGSVCATNIYGLAGGTTAATGWNFSANSGIARGGGVGTVYSPSGDANAAAANVCLLLSGSGQTSGQIVYVQQ